MAIKNFPITNKSRIIDNNKCKFIGLKWEKKKRKETLMNQIDLISIFVYFWKIIIVF